jgi:hypothetical protein
MGRPEETTKILPGLFSVCAVPWSDFDSGLNHARLHYCILIFLATPLHAFESSELEERLAAPIRDNKYFRAGESVRDCRRRLPALGFAAPCRSFALLGGVALFSTWYDSF